MNQPDTVKQNIIDWCAEDNIPCVTRPSPNGLEWVLQIGKDGNQITIYKQTRLLDRIYIQSQINLSETHRTLVNQTWNSRQRNNMMFNLTKLASQYDVGMTFARKGEEVTGITTNKIHFHSTISKSELLEKYLRVEQIHAVLLNQLNRELGIAVQRSKVDERSGVDSGR